MKITMLRSVGVPTEQKQILSRSQRPGVEEAVSEKIGFITDVKERTERIEKQWIIK